MMISLFSTIVRLTSPAFVAFSLVFPIVFIAMDRKLKGFLQIQRISVWKQYAIQFMKSKKGKAITILIILTTALSIYYYYTLIPSVDVYEISLNGSGSWTRQGNNVTMYYNLNITNYAEKPIHIPRGELTILNVTGPGGVLILPTKEDSLYPNFTLEPGQKVSIMISPTIETAINPNHIFFKVSLYIDEAKAERVRTFSCYFSPPSS